MAQGRSTKVISMNKWIRTSGLSIKNSLILSGELDDEVDSDQWVVNKELSLSLR